MLLTLDHSGNQQQITNKFIIMKSILAILVTATAIGCTNNSKIISVPADKIKIAVRPVVINDNDSRSETDVLWVNIKKQP